MAKTRRLFGRPQSKYDDDFITKTIDKKIEIKIRIIAFPVKISLSSEEDDHLTNTAPCKLKPEMHPKNATMVKNWIIKPYSSVGKTFVNIGNKKKGIADDNAPPIV